MKNVSNYLTKWTFFLMLGLLRCITNIAGDGADSCLINERSRFNDLPLKNHATGKLNILLITCNMDEVRVVRRS